MKLGELIKFLESYSQDQDISFGIGNACPYYGSPNSLAFEVVLETSVINMLNEVKECLITIFVKNDKSQFTVNLETEIYLVNKWYGRRDNKPLELGTLIELFKVK